MIVSQIVTEPSKLPLSQGNQKLWAAATALETTFISEMLKAAGLGESRESFGGGVGEEQFSSFLRDAQAKNLAESGGFGLADSLYQALKVRGNE